MAKRGGKTGSTIIIRREEGGGGGHHGGAWKVAYADFVTAMMAFFLLMWLLNATTEQQRRGIAAYFSPMASVENGFSGAGLVPGGISPLTGGTSLVNKGTGSPPSPTATPATPVPAAAAGQAPADGDGAPPTADSDDDDQPSGTARLSAQAVGKDAAGASVADAAQPGAQPASTQTAAGRAAQAAAEDTSLKGAMEQMRQLVAADPALADSANQMAIDVTPEGLRIQIMDSERQPMFDRGAAILNARASALLRKVAPFLATLPEPVSIGGYTDGAPWAPGTATNWTLSSGRANAARDLLVASGLPDGRISDVSGFADRHLLLPADPMASANRRVVLTLRRQHELQAGVVSSATGG